MVSWICSNEGPEIFFEAKDFMQRLEKKKTFFLLLYSITPIGRDLTLYSLP